MSSKSRPRRTARKDPWDENELVTSSKSKLINLDLVKILAEPQAWNCLEEDEKRQILHLLPEHIHPTADLCANDPTSGSEAKIPPLPREFLRYSNNWRGGVRQFQVDLECGRYDPEWLSQADEAMKERADGKFDKWKEKEFEQFWGQKQKLDWASYAGEASQVRLETLVANGVIHKGDIWTYARSFLVGDKGTSYAHAFFTGDKGDQAKVLVEKEVKVVDIVGTSLTFAAPAGQRVIFPHHIEISQARLAAARNSVKSNKSSRKREPRHDETSTNTIPQRGTKTSKRRGSAEEASARKKRQVEQEGNEDSEYMPNMNDGEMFQTEIKNVQASVPEDKDTASELKPDSALDSNVKAIGVNGDQQTTDPLAMEATREFDEDRTAESTDTKGKQGHHAEVEPVKADAANGLESKEEITQSDPEITEEKLPESQPASPQDELVLVPNITTPNSLENEILAIDGRFKGVRNVNTWKALRCHRNNQDMGSLWEVRHGWYLKRDK